MLTDKQMSISQFHYWGWSNKAFDFDKNCIGCIGQQLTEELKSFDADHEQIAAQLATLSLQATLSYITSRLSCCILFVVNLTILVLNMQFSYFFKRTILLANFNEFLMGN